MTEDWCKKKRLKNMLTLFIIIKKCESTQSLGVQWSGVICMSSKKFFFSKIVRYEISCWSSSFSSHLAHETNYGLNRSTRSFFIVATYYYSIEKNEQGTDKIKWHQCVSKTTDKYLQGMYDHDCLQDTRTVLTDKAY